MLVVPLLWTQIRYAPLHSEQHRYFTILWQEQEAQYNLLLSLQTELLSFIKDGVLTRDVYQHAIDYIKEKNPDLEKHFVKNVGFSVRCFSCIPPHISTHPYFKTGIEFRDATYLLSPKNLRLLRKNMILNLSLGFTSLTDKSGQRLVLQHSSLTCKTLISGCSDTRWTWWIPSK